MPGERVMYHYVDEHGTDVIVDRLDGIPPAFRGKAEVVDGAGVNQTRTPAVTRGGTGVPDIEVPDRPPEGLAYSANRFVAGLHGPSVLVGVLLALFAGMVGSIVLSPKFRSLKSMSAALLLLTIGLVWFMALQTSHAPPPVVPAAQPVAPAAARPPPGQGTFKGNELGPVLEQIEQLSK